MEVESSDQMNWSFIRAESLAWLSSIDAESYPHSGRTLLAHLVGTFDLLRSWESPDYVCVAGMFHSVYGTNSFERSIMALDNRIKLRALIGARAERLVYLFCVAKRPLAFIEGLENFTIVDRVTGVKHAVTERELIDLLLIEYANLLEQGGGHEFWKWIDMLTANKKEKILTCMPLRNAFNFHTTELGNSAMNISFDQKINDFDRDKYLVIDELVAPDVAEIAWRYYQSYVSVPGYYETDDDTFSLDRYADAFGEALIPGVQRKIEERIGRALIPTYSYVRIYTTQSKLTKHVDRGSCEISATMTVGYKNAEGLWPIYIESEGADKPIELEVGQALLYKGMEVPHWRQPLPKGIWCQIFFHFVEAHGDMTDHRFDNRPKLGPVMSRKEAL